MANYTFLNKETNEEFDIDMPISQLDTYKAENPHLEQRIKRAPAIADPSRLGLKKPDAGFRDVLKRVKKASGRNNTINTW
ncbi:hypothetical protein UFOVP247_79 [uncultured Caudovirales phage]|uniref:Uncharacterized protein n=1 Tax=uncultured Caudovirales phage TaxID=2100421 RepID=A0A6J7WW73_9CAUD|nr:hypothetical protein UFOVP247_79 [uncultured Caudovirales phage]